ERGEEELAEAHPRRIPGATPRLDQCRSVTNPDHPGRGAPSPSSSQRIAYAQCTGPMEPGSRGTAARAAGAVGAVRNASRANDDASARRLTIGASWRRTRSTSHANAGSPQSPASRGWSWSLRTMRARSFGRSSPDLGARPLVGGASDADGPSVVLPDVM